MGNALIIAGVVFYIVNMEINLLIEISKSEESFENLSKRHGFNEKTIRNNLKKFNLKKIKTKRKKYEMKKRMLNDKNPNWGGKDVGMSGIHSWVRRRKSKPPFCEECNIKKPNDLANISEEYKRDINDFRWLCRSCHMKSDGRLKNLKNSEYFKGGVIQCVSL